MTGSGRGTLAGLFTALLATLVVAGPGRLPAADGALDPFFDGDGSNKFGYSPGTTAESGAGVAVQASGRIVVVGHTSASDPAYGGAEMNVFGIRRDGGLDAGFGFGGARRVGTADDDTGRAIAVQRGGAIVLAGSTPGLVGPDFLVCRLKPGGAVDRSFGVRGCRRIAVANASPQSVAIQRDGKIVIAGMSGLAEDFTVVRLTADGRLDRTFGGSGVVTVNLDGWDLPYAVAVQRDGKLVVAGTTEGALSHDFAVVRLRPGGALDTSFGGDGTVILDLAGDTDEVHGIAIQPDGKIVLAGETYNAGFGDFDMAIARLDAAGNLDPGFNGGAWQLVHFGDTRNDSAWDVRVLRDGRIVAGGTTYHFSDDDFALAWLNPDGSLDASAGFGGLVITDVEGGGKRDQGKALAFQKDGKLVLAGNTTDFAGDVAVARYLVDLPWNGGFERDFAAAGKADLWRLRRTLATDGRDCAVRHLDSCALKLTARRASRPAKRAEQWTGAAGKKDDAYAITAWTRAEGAAGAGPFEVQVTFAYRDGTRGRFRLRPAAGTHDWEESTLTVRAAKPYRNVKVAAVYGKTAGTVWFDDILAAPQQ